MPEAHTNEIHSEWKHIFWYWRTRSHIATNGNWSCSIKMNKTQQSIERQSFFVQLLNIDDTLCFGRTICYTLQENSSENRCDTENQKVPKEIYFYQFVLFFCLCQLGCFPCFAFVTFPLRLGQRTWLDKTNTFWYFVLWLNSYYWWISLWNLHHFSLKLKRSSKYKVSINSDHGLAPNTRQAVTRTTKTQFVDVKTCVTRHYDTCVLRSNNNLLGMEKLAVLCYVTPTLPVFFNSF